MTRTRDELAREAQALEATRLFMFETVGIVPCPQHGTEHLVAIRTYQEEEAHSFRVRLEQTGPVIALDLDSVSERTFDEQLERIACRPPGESCEHISGLGECEKWEFEEGE
jgi:hypothetical protein